MSNNKASIDIGSNSILLLIVNAKFSEKIEYSFITELGKDINKTKLFSPSSMESTFNALSEYRKIIISNGIDPSEVIVTATEAARSVNNADEFFHRVYSELGFKVNILSSEGEAYYSARGVCLGLSESKKDLLAIDLGGGSTELIKITGQLKVPESISIPVGAVRSQDYLLQNGEDVLNNYFDELFTSQEISSSINKFKFKFKERSTTICLAGTFVFLANILSGYYQSFNKAIHGSNINYYDLVKFLDENKMLSPQKLEEKFPCLGKRSLNFIGGLMLAKKLLFYLAIDSFEISTYGLRHGTLDEGGIKDEFLFKK
ncbi:MAG: hypothetical protein HQK49_01955 [Oligoflexia bacterium]|nr:hypothetical protein [Oligoflexia bacterium]